MTTAWRNLRRACGAALAAAFLLAAPAGAQEGDGQPNEQNDPGALAREGAQRIIQALEGLLQIIPQYGMPRIEDDGDIVIPRLNPQSEDKSAPKDAPESDGKDEPVQTEI